MNSLTLWQRFLADKKRYLTSLSAFVAGIAILIVYSQSGPSHASYLIAETAFEKWSSSPNDTSLFRDMQAALRKVPQLESKYEALIAQTLLDRAQNEEQIAQAVTFAAKSLSSSLHEEVPFHAAYGENSLKIEQGAYQEALEKAVSLKEAMGKVPEMISPKSPLYVYNLIRIASLQQKLANRPGEKAAWEELEQFLSTSNPAVQNFQEKGLDLSHYIAERKKQL